MNKHKSIDGMSNVSRRLAQIRAEENSKQVKDSFWVRRVRPVMKFLLQVVGTVYVVGTSLMYVINQFTSHNFQFGYAVGLAIFADAVALFLIFDNRR